MFRQRMTPDGTLVLRNIEKKDGGVYGCLASNQAGTDTMTSTVTYIGKCQNAQTFTLRVSHIHTQKCMHTSITRFLFAVSVEMFYQFYNNSPTLESPVVRVDLHKILIGIGETTVMACSASGVPQPEIWWYKGIS